MLKFTNEQIDKISELFLDVAKGLFLTVLTLQILNKSDIAIFSQNLLGGIMSTYVSLKMLELKRSRRR